MRDEEDGAETEEARGEQPGRVRIVGAEPAGRLAGSASGPVGGEPDTSIARSEDVDDAVGPGDGPAEDVFELDPETPEEGWPEAVTMPHWTEAPTGEVPAVLHRDAGDGSEDGGDRWSSVPGPTWRQEDSDWEAQEVTYEVSVLAQDETRRGSLDEASMAERQPWTFDLPGTVDGPDVGDADSSGFGALSDDGDDLRRDEPVAVVPALGGDRRTDPEPGREAGVEAGATGAAGAAGATGAEALEEADAGAVDEGRPRRGLPTGEVEVPGRRRLRRAITTRPVPPAPPARARGRTSRPVPEAPPGLERRHLSRAPTVGGRHPHAPSGTSRGERSVPVAIVTGLVVGAVALVAFELGNVAAMVVSTVVIGLVALELFAAFRKAGYRPVTLLGVAATVSLMVAVYNRGLAAFPLVIVLLVAFTMVWHLAGVDRDAEPISSTGTTLLAFCWVGVFGSFAALFLNPTLFPDRHGLAFVFGAVLVVIGYDVGAMFAGSTIGRHQVAPHVSPNKTWEGLIGGGVLAVLVGLLVVHYLHPWTLASAAVLGVVAAVVSPIGDVSESLVKRQLGLKDMGRILPAHGGLFDRLDGLLYMLPATYYLVKAFHLG